MNGYEKTIDDLLKNEDPPTHSGPNPSHKQSKQGDVQRIKEYGAIRASKYEVIKVELISWYGKKPSLSIMRYNKEGRPIKGMLYSKEMTLELIGLLTNAVKDDF